MNFALVDDQPLQLNIMKEMLESALDRMGIDDRDIRCYWDAGLFLRDFEAGKFDIIILDIYMGEFSGVEVAHRVREKDDSVTLAFCTSSNEFASQSYDVGARDYLQKPITEDKVARMLARFQLDRIERNRSIRLPDGSRVPLWSIVYAEYVDHSVKVHIKGQSPRMIRCNQSDIEALLTQYKGFYVINKGCIVNFAQVSSIETNAFVMQNGETVPVARRRFKEIEAAYTRYVFDKMEEEVNE